jgi:2-oxoacid:acceptor oxidoreductase gamma subunit (pyruvate/2-ketoisovalerate family)
VRAVARGKEHAAAPPLRRRCAERSAEMRKEIRWHGRAGQGAALASRLLAEALFDEGWQVQAAGDYPPEGSAPTEAYDRLSDRPLEEEGEVTAPDVVVVLDPSLLSEVDVTAGLKADGTLLLNGDESERDGVRDAVERLGWHGRTLLVPGDAVAAEYSGHSAAGVLLGAVAAVLERPAVDTLQHRVECDLGARLSPRMLGAAREAIERGYGTVHSEAPSESPQ